MFHVVPERAHDLSRWRLFVAQEVKVSGVLDEVRIHPRPFGCCFFTFQVSALIEANQCASSVAQLRFNSLSKFLTPPLGSPSYKTWPQRIETNKLQLLLFSRRLHQHLGMVKLLIFLGLRKLQKNPLANHSV